VEKTGRGDEKRSESELNGKKVQIEKTLANRRDEKKKERKKEWPRDKMPFTLEGFKSREKREAGQKKHSSREGESGFSKKKGGGPDRRGGYPLPCKDVQKEATEDHVREDAKKRSRNIRKRKNINDLKKRPLHQEEKTRRKKKKTSQHRKKKRLVPLGGVSPQKKHKKGFERGQIPLGPQRKIYRAENRHHPRTRRKTTRGEPTSTSPRGIRRNCRKKGHSSR